MCPQYCGYSGVQAIFVPLFQLVCLSICLVVSTGELPILAKAKMMSVEEGEFQHRSTTPKCSKDRSCVERGGDGSELCVCTQCVLNNMYLRATLLHYYKTAWSMSSVKTSILSASLRNNCLWKMDLTTMAYYISGRAVHTWDISSEQLANISRQSINVYLVKMLNTSQCACTLYVLARQIVNAWAE